MNFQHARMFVFKKLWQGLLGIEVAVDTSRRLQREDEYYSPLLIIANKPKIVSRS